MHFNHQIILFVLVDTTRYAIRVCHVSKHYQTLTPNAISPFVLCQVKTAPCALLAVSFRIVFLISFSFATTSYSVQVALK